MIGLSLSHRLPTALRCGSLMACASRSPQGRSGSGRDCSAPSSRALRTRQHVGSTMEVPMTAEQPRVVIGMDPHKRSATIEVMIADETIVGGGRFATDTAGYRTMLDLAAQWPQRVWAIEGCNGIGRHIAQSPGPLVRLTDRTSVRVSCMHDVVGPAARPAEESGCALGDRGRPRAAGPADRRPGLQQRLRELGARL